MVGKSQELQVTNLLNELIPPGAMLFLDRLGERGTRKVRYWPSDQPVGQQVAVGGQVNPFVNNAPDRPTQQLPGPEHRD